MSVTTTSTGSNSCQIAISGETSAANIIAAINTALVGYGWSLIDTVSSGSRNCMVTKVYSAPNIDGPGNVTTGGTTKYMILRFDAPKQFWYISACEYWNATTHIATNETFLPNRMFPAPLQYSNNIIYMFASQRYACFMGSVRGENGPWQGVFEFQREAAEDTAASGYPCFGWTSSLTIGESYWAGGSTATFGPTPFCFSLPRSRSGYTGQAASQEFVIQTPLGTFPPTKNQCLYNWSSYPSGFTLRPESTNGHQGALGSFGTQYSSYKYDAGKKIASNLKLAGADSSYPAGKIYGLKVVAPLGNIMDTAQLPVDTSGFFSTSGTLTPHILAGIHGGFALDNAVTTNRLSRTSYSDPAIITSAPTQCIIVGGKYLWLATTQGIRRLDVISSIVDSVTAVTTTDIIYDGAQYIYGSTVNGITRVDVNALTTTLMAGPSGGYGALSIDDTYLYAAQRTSTTQPKVDIITLSTNTIARTFTTVTPTASSVFSGIYNTDYSGDYIYAMSFATGQMTKIQVSNATLNSVSVWSGVMTSWNPYVMYDGNNFYLVGQQPDTNGREWIVKPSDLTSVWSFNPGASYTYNDGSTYYYTRYMTPFKGYMWWPHSNTSVAACTNPRLVNYGTPTALIPLTPGGDNLTCAAGFWSTSCVALVSDGVANFGAKIGGAEKITNAYDKYNTYGYVTAQIAFQL